MGFISAFEGLITPHAGGVVLRKKPQSRFWVSVKFWRHPDLHIWIPSSSTQRLLRA